MAYCRNCGGEAGILKMCNDCGAPIEENNTKLKQSDDNDIYLYFFLSLLVPFVGFVLYYRMRNTAISEAKSSLVGGLMCIAILAAFYLTTSAIEEPYVYEPPIYYDVSKNEILLDAIAVEEASKLYCKNNVCDVDQELTWGTLRPFIEGIDEGYYVSTNTVVVSSRIDGRWHVYLEANGTNQYEFVRGGSPSYCDLSCVVKDED